MLIISNLCRTPEEYERDGMVLYPLQIFLLKWSLFLKTLLGAGLLPLLAWILVKVDKEAPFFSRTSFDPEYDYIVGMYIAL